MLRVSRSAPRRGACIHEHGRARVSAFVLRYVLVYACDHMHTRPATALRDVTAESLAATPSCLRPKTLGLGIPIKPCAGLA